MRSFIMNIRAVIFLCVVTALPAQPAMANQQHFHDEFVRMLAFFNQIEKHMRRPMFRIRIIQTPEERLPSNWYLPSSQPTIQQPSTAPLKKRPFDWQPDTSVLQGNSQSSSQSVAKKGVTFSDVKGQEAAIQEVSEVVDFLKHPHKYERLGAEIPRGILLEGPPGCGKTLLARAVAGEAGCAFIDACGSNFINKYVGTGANNVRRLFARARAQAPAIIFIDEIDALARRKDDTNEEYHHTMNALLSELDGFKKNDNIIVMAATNFAKSLDKALTRPGRFDRIINVGLPTKKGRKEIVSHYADKVLLDPTISLDTLSQEFAQRTTGFSGAELKKLANEAALSACREGAAHVTTKHFEEAYDKITLGLPNNFERTTEQLKRTACHEAGHALIKILTNQPVAKLSILSRGSALGVTFGKEKYESSSEYVKEELLAKIMALQAGYLAEKIMCNCSRPGAVDDIERAYGIARAMVKEFGMGRGLEGIRYSNDMSPVWKEKFDDEISRILKKCSEKVEVMLQKNKSKLEALTKELLEKETLTEAETQKIVAAA